MNNLILLSFFMGVLQFSVMDSVDFKKHKISITLENIHEISNNHVGHDWDFYLSVNGQNIIKGEKVEFELKTRAPLVIKAHAHEKDKNHSDHGESSMTLIYSDLIAIEKNRFELDVDIIENGGQYAGNLAKQKFVFLIEKVK